MEIRALQEVERVQLINIIQNPRTKIFKTRPIIWKVSHYGQAWRWIIVSSVIALRYWGRNEIKDDAADIHGLTQQSITTVCRRVARAILKKKSDFIQMPISLNEQLDIMKDFEAIAGFKNVIGTIDCIHIRVLK